LFYTVNGAHVWAESNAYSPVDTMSLGTRWSPVQTVQSLATPASAGWFNHWHASEYLKLSSVVDRSILAGFDDGDAGIVYDRMTPASSPYLFGLDCDALLTGVDDSPHWPLHPQLSLIGARPSRLRVRFQIDLPARMRVHLAVYDVMGRRVRTLMDAELPGGATDVVWDGRGSTGAMAGSGVYFASMTTADGRRSVRVQLIR
jgi:hypothetical protein